MQLEIAEEQQGYRLDRALAELMPDVSRAQIQSWIKDRRVAVNGQYYKQTHKLDGGEQVVVDMPPPVAQDDWLPEDIALQIVYQDEALLVINKPSGLVVHPGAGNTTGTLLNALIYHYPDSQNLPRAGIVHRLDKDTSGLMVVAKTEKARLHLIDQLSDRTLSREYKALVVGNLISGGTINQPIMRDPGDRRRMAVAKRHSDGKEAITHYRVAERYRRHTLLSVKLETGRTHQIRVHMTWKGYPLAGDPVYGKRLVIPKRCEPELAELLRQFKRQALHAESLAYEHPETGEVQSWTVPIPEDMRLLCDGLEKDHRENES